MKLTTIDNVIRPLDERELSLVSGGITLGTGPKGIFSPANIASAGRLATGLGHLGTAFSVGFIIGTYGYNSYTRYKYNAP